MAANKQTCLICQKTAEREEGTPPLEDCPTCGHPFQKPIVFTPKTGNMGAVGNKP